MHIYSVESFLKSKYAALRKHKAIFFMALLSITIFSIYLILAASFEVKTDITSIQPFNTSYNLINFTINNTYADVNITSVVIAFPSGLGFEINASSNGSTPAVGGLTGIANFSFINSLTLNWSNITFGLINNFSAGSSGGNRSFWIAVNTSKEGEMGINVTGYYSNGLQNSTNFTLTVSDTIVPVPSNIIPGGSNFTSDTTPTIYIDITDLGMGVNTSDIDMEVSKNGAPFNDITETISVIAGGFQVSYTYGAGIVGGDNLSIKVNAKDNSSSRNVMTEVKWNITIDTAAPNITVTSPSAHTNLTSDTDNITVQVSDQWSSVSVNSSDVFAALQNGSGATLHYYRLDSIQATGDYRTWTNLKLSGSDYNATLNSTNLSDGTYTLYVNASDLAGNVKEDSTIKITIDNTAPSAFVLSEPANNTNSTVRTPVLKWSATNEVNFINYTIQIDDDVAFGSINETKSTSTNASNTTTLSTLAADGKFYWRVTAWDAAGNSYTAPKLIYITDNTPPTIAIVMPSSDTNLTGAADNITISVTENVSAVYGALKSAAGTYYDLAGALATGDFTTWTALKNIASGVWYNTTLNSDGFTEGTYTLYINATDMAGNNRTNSDRKITIDNTAPSEFSLTTPANNTVSTSRTPTLTWAATTETNFVNYTVQIDNSVNFGSIDYTETTTTLNTVSSTTTTVATNLEANTKFYWRVTAWDNASNSRTTPMFVYTTDNAAPVISIASPLNNTNQTASNVNITANVTDTNLNITDVYAALYNGSGASAHYYTLAGTLTTGDYRTWTNLERSGATQFFNATLNADSFADGSYLLYVNASDNASTLAVNSSINITIDNTAPTYADLLPGVANFTNTQFPIFFINLTDARTYVDNNSIDVWVQVNTAPPVNRTTSTVRKNIPNGIQVSYTFVDPLSNGDVIYANVSASDSVGNAMTTVSWSFTVDIVAPEIEIIAPSTNQTNQTASDVNITVKVTDTNRNNSDVWAALHNGSGASAHYYKLDGTKLGNVDYRSWTNLDQSGATQFFNATLNADSFADGEYIIYVNATDLGGSSTQNTSYILHIDNTAPTIALGTPATGANASATNLTFVWNATDQIDTSLTCNLTLDSIVNRSNIEVDNATDIVNKSVSIADLTNGAHTWSVTCIDDMKNIGTSATRTFYTESSAFTLEINSPVNYLNTTSNNAILNWTINNPAYSAVWCNVSLDNMEINNTVQIEVVNGTNKNWFNLSGLAEGLHQWNVSCRDALYLVNSSTRYLTYDAAAPAVSITNPTNATNHTISKTPTITFNVSDAHSLGNFTCELFLKSGVTTTSKGVNTSTVNDTNYATTSTINASETAEGAYDYYVNCTDFSGNTGSSKRLTVTIDATAPIIQIRAPANNTNQTFSLNVNVTVNITETNLNTSDVFAALKNSSGYYLLNGVVNINRTGDYRNWTRLISSGATTFYNSTLNASNFSDGTYTLYVNASDFAGNNGSAPIMTIVIDKTPPVIQNATFNNASVGRTVGISVNVSDETSGVAGSALDGSTSAIGNCTFYFNSTFMGSVLYNATKGYCNTTFTVPGTFTAGNYTLGINITDWAGNNGTNTSYTIQVFSDTEAPAVRITAPSANYTNQSSTSLTVAWTATDNLATSLTCNISIINGTTAGSAPTNSTGNITTTVASAGSNSTILTGMNNSKYNISVSCWDDAGNQNATGSIIDLLIDSVAPVVEITTTNRTNVSATAATLSFNVTDAYSANFTCELFFSGSTSKGINASNVVNSTSAQVHTINSSASSEGSYYYYINCTDYTGNIGNSATKIIIFDTSAPAVTINQPQANDYNRSSLLINVTAIDTYTNATTNTTLQYRFVNTSGVGNTTAWDNFTLTTMVSATITYDVTTLIDGTYTIQVRANDTVNNQNATTNVSITIDNTGPALSSWRYSSISKNLTLVFNETVDSSSIDLSKIAINYTGGSDILTIIRSGATVTAIDSSQYSTAINISLVQADYETLDPKMSETVKLTIQANAIKDRTGNNMVKNYTTVTSWTKYIVRRPAVYGTYLVGDTIEAFSLTLNALQSATSLGGNYNITNVLASISGNYAIFYAYNRTSGSWLWYAPGTGGTFANFTTDTDETMKEINMSVTDAIEIV